MLPQKPSGAHNRLSFRRPFYQTAMTPSPGGSVHHPLDVRFGSITDIEARRADVRFTPKSGHCRATLGCPLCAKSRLVHRSKKDCYSITSVAAVISVGGTVRPRAFAVFKLITSSNLVGACTGMSAGFSPLRMRST